jgi:hypothetical protein
MAANLIDRSVLLNTLPVTVLPTAASDRQGVFRLYLSEQGRASNSLGGEAIAETVIAVTLDSLLDHFDPPQVLICTWWRTMGADRHDGQTRSTRSQTFRRC